MTNEPTNQIPQPGDLCVWWIPQVPGRMFYARVSNTTEAILLIKTLAEYDKFQFENNIKPDYASVGGLHVYEDGQWVDWDCDGYSIHDVMEQNIKAGTDSSRVTHGKET